MSKNKTGWHKYQQGPVRQTSASAEFVVTIESLGNNGDGIGRHEGKVVFVPFTLPGEMVRVKATTRKKSYLRALKLETLQSADERQTPPCPYFERCGGCEWQHVPYALQLETKVEQLADVLVRIGQLNAPDISAIVASDLPYHYRNRIQGTVRNGQFHYRQRGSNKLIAIEQCAIAEQAINRRLAEGLTHLPEGRLEIATEGDETVISPMADEHASDIGFRQVNTQVSVTLSQMVDSIVQQHNTDIYIDLFCGRGSWSISMARRHTHSRIVGVDSSAFNIEMACETARVAGLHNVRFVHGRVENVIKSLQLDNSVCIVDPPRAGLDEKVCIALCENPPELIIYISCHPASLARDLQKLTAHRFTVSSITPFDMFPQTSHLECVCVLERLPAKAA